jgi:hypothetical protein
METIKLDLSEKQMKKLAMGGAVMVSPSMMGGAVECTLNPTKCARMRKNHTAGKKYLLRMGETELKGGSFKSFLRGAKKAAKFVGKATGEALKFTGRKAWDEWQEKFKPIYGPKIRAGLKYGLDAGLETLAAATGQEELVAVAAAIAKGLHPLVDKLGDYTNAFGARKGKPSSPAVLMAAGFREKLAEIMEEAMMISEANQK